MTFRAKLLQTILTLVINAIVICAKEEVIINADSVVVMIVQ